MRAWLNRGEPAAIDRAPFLFLASAHAPALPDGKEVLRGHVVNAFKAFLKLLDRYPAVVVLVKLIKADVDQLLVQLLRGNESVEEDPFASLHACITCIM